MTEAKPLSRWEGCLLGLAVGDALGAPLEFQRRERIIPITGMIEGGKFRMRRGEWTDDTAMALCLADSLLACDGLNAADQMAHYWRWANDGENSTRQRAFGIGKTVAKAVARYQRSGEPWCGSDALSASGNGSIMRLAPVAMRYAGAPSLTVHAEASSRTTHASPLCLSACRLMALLLERALLGETTKSRWLDTVGLESGDYHSMFMPLLAGEYRDKAEEEIRGSGYVLESLEAALWCLWHSDNFADAVLKAANLGDDADTTAAVTGQLAGAFYGVTAIPALWCRQLHAYDRIRDRAVKLHAAWQGDYQASLKKT
ncbi:ADP-ribosylglycohydrolase family protein [Halomonas sp. PR-M31]|uniref:ADP-ribosylglycohydrolase family protein n=1 Tax=Halomonas sp. PR-M31 TaxID=1471202 RepID=UPI000650FB79|nr:ADP-ribosylglycohydrolase family protein [Halomonas sp. PR-M31]